MCYKILCIGEILFDIYPDTRHLGGAPFNFSYHMHQLRNEVAFVSRIGDDENGKEILRILKECDYPIGFIQIDKDHPTGNVMVELDVKAVPTFTITPNVAYDFIEYDDGVQKLLDNVDLFYFGTLALRCPVSQKTIQNILNNRLPTTKVFYDINLRQNFYTETILRESLQQSDIVKLNNNEFKFLKELLNLSHSEVEAANSILQEFELSVLCITKGEKGNVLYTEDEKLDLKLSAAYQKNSVDTVGAGDAFAAILAFGLLKKWDFSTILKRATDFAVDICEIPGAIPRDSEFYQKYKDEWNL